jgi:hypothetical protein
MISGLQNVTTPQPPHLTLNPTKVNTLPSSPPEETERCCLEALKAGYRHVSSQMLAEIQAPCPICTNI